MKFGVREICDVVFKSTDTRTIGSTTYQAGQPVLYIDTAKTGTLEGAATTVYAQGGKGNSRLLAWEGEKTLTFTVEDAMLSPMGMTVLAGAIQSATATSGYQHITLDVQCAVGSSAVTFSLADLKTAGVIPATATGFVIAPSGTATTYLVQTDSAGALTSNLGSGMFPASGYTTGVTGSVTLSNLQNNPSTGANVTVDFYILRSDNKVTELQVDAGTFAGYYYVEATTLFRDQATGADLPAEIVIPKAKIQSNFTFNLASSGDPSTFSFVMDAFPATTKFSGSKQVLCVIQVIG